LEKKVKPRHAASAASPALRPGTAAPTAHHLHPRIGDLAAIALLLTRGHAPLTAAAASRVVSSAAPGACPFSNARRGMVE